MRQINTLLGLDNYENNNCILLINNNVNLSIEIKLLEKYVILKMIMNFIKQNKYLWYIKKNLK